MRFRKKPVIIEAFMIGLHQEPEWFISHAGVKRFPKDHHSDYVIKTLEGEMTATFGDWIIKGVKGEIYPCKSDIFEKTYEEVE